MEVPKPVFKKKPKAKNNPVPTKESECALCHKWRVCETHEVYGGINRQISIANGYQVALCKPCHEDVTRNREYTLESQKRWRMLFQKIQMEDWIKEGFPENEVLDKWIQLIGKSYL